MTKNLIALLLILAALMGALGELNGWLLPTVSWPFTVSREVPFLNCSERVAPFLAADEQVNWFGWLSMLLLLLSVRMGSVSLSAGALWEAFRGRGDPAVTGILMQIRLPRALTALLLGGALSLSGLLLQTFFHNPIAGPFVLGISSGAKLIIAICMVFALQAGIKMSSTLMIIAAFLGAMMAMGFVLVLSKRIKGQGMLIVGGVMIGYICSAITELIITFANDSDIVNLHNWSLGSFSGITWSNVSVSFIVVMAASIAVFMLSKPISAYQLGENYAANVGVNVRVFRALLVLLSSLLAACVTAFAGPISFVCIAVPQLIKGLFKTSKPILMIPACFLGGGVFCLFCDLIARIAFAPTELSISTVTAVFGAPVVIWVLIRRHKSRM